MGNEGQEARKPKHSNADYCTNVVDNVARKKGLFTPYASVNSHIYTAKSYTNGTIIGGRNEQSKIVHKNQKKLMTIMKLALVLSNLEEWAMS